AGVREMSGARVRFDVLLLAAGVLLAALGGDASAQRGAAASASPKASAPVDFTGYWVAVVSEDWRHRMATPRKGDYESVPLNGNGRRAADAWSLDADNAANLQCKAFGVGGLMRQPGRLHVTWADDDTLRVDFDASTMFKREKDGAKWAPRPCGTATPPAGAGQPQRPAEPLPR